MDNKHSTLADMFNAAAETAESDDEVAKGTKSVTSQQLEESNEDNQNTNTEVIEPQNQDNVETPKANDKVISTSEAPVVKTPIATEVPVSASAQELEQPDEELVQDENVNVINANSIAQILKISDLYRQFDDDTNNMAQRFFNTDNESEAICLALQQEPITLDALNSFSKVHSAEAVDKAFFLVALPDNLLEEIGRLIEVLTDKDIKASISDHIKYCRNLESELSKMDDDFINETNSILVLLQAAQPNE